MGEKIAVMIRRDLYDKVKRFIKEEGGFSSVEEFIEYVIEQALETDIGEADFNEKDMEKVSERLKELGYM